jgi:hypothetical protein
MRGVRLPTSSGTGSVSPRRFIAERIAAPVHADASAAVEWVRGPAELTRRYAVGQRKRRRIADQAQPAVRRFSTMVSRLRRWTRYIAGGSCGGSAPPLKR